MTASRVTLTASRALIGCLLALLAGALLVPALAQADLTSEVAQGRAVAESLQSGQKSCSDLSEADFELAGEYAMDQYLGDTAAHEAMNARMSQVMGEQGEAAMHAALGHRFTGCAGGPAGSWAMPMAGMMGGSGSYGAGSGHGPGPNADGGDSYGPGMMGSQHPGIAGDDDGIGAGAAIAIALVAALLGGLLVGGAYTLGRRS